MNNPNLPDNMQSRTDQSLPWNQEELTCNGCGNADAYQDGDTVYCKYCEYEEYPPELEDDHE
jgi:hypothetical protein